MPIESVWIAALDKRKEMVVDVEAQVQKYLGLPLNKFWSGDGSHSDIPYDRTDVANAAAYSCYGVDEGRTRHGNAFLSHKWMFKKILEQGYNNALILEEDVYFIEDRWKTIFPYVNMNITNSDDWGCYYLGWQCKAYEGDSDDLNEVEDDWKNGRNWCVQPVRNMYNNISGLHAVVLNKRLMTRLSKLAVGPMDTYLGQSTDRFLMYYVCPKIIGSLASYSNAEGRWQDRSTLT